MCMCMNDFCYLCERIVERERKERERIILLVALVIGKEKVERRVVYIEKVIS